MIIIIGALTPAAILIPDSSFIPNILPLKISWQLPSVLLCAIVCGPKPAAIASISYLTIGIFYLPIFHGGGSIGYLLTPEIGYLIGFTPASILTGVLAKNEKTNRLIRLTLISMLGMIVIHITGIINLLWGGLTDRWSESTIDLLISYSLIPMANQFLICPSIAIISISMKKILFIK